MKETVILTATGWTGTGPWFQTLTFGEPVADGVVSVIPAASEKQKQAFTRGNIVVSTINGQLVTFKATTNKPTLNIPVDFTYSEAGKEALDSVAVVGTKTSGTAFSGTITREAFNKLKEGNVPLIINILDSSTKKTVVAIKMPSYTFDVASNTVAALAPVIPTAGGTISFWGVLINGTSRTVTGAIATGGGGGGGSAAVWGAITGLITDQTDLMGKFALKENIANKATDLSSNDDTHYPTTKAVKSVTDGKPGYDSRSEYWKDKHVAVVGSDGKLTAYQIDGEKVLTDDKIVNDLITGGATKIASAETVKTLEAKKAEIDDALSSSAVKTYSIDKIIALLELYGATFRGSFATKAALDAYTGAKDKNDRAIVQVDETQSNEVTMYEYNGTAWTYLYSMKVNFSTAQWAAIDSGITATLVAKIDTAVQTAPLGTNKFAYEASFTNDDRECKLKLKRQILDNTGATDVDEVMLPVSQYNDEGNLLVGLYSKAMADIKQDKDSLETDVEAKGFTKGGVKVIKVNGEEYTGETTDLGNVVRDVSDKQSKITFGTTDPSGGEDGDVYIKYVA